MAACSPHFGKCASHEFLCSGSDKKGGSIVKMTAFCSLSLSLAVLAACRKSFYHVRVKFCPIWVGTRKFILSSNRLVNGSVHQILRKLPTARGFQIFLFRHCFLSYIYKANNMSDQASKITCHDGKKAVDGIKGCVRLTTSWHGCSLDQGGGCPNNQYTLGTGDGHQTICCSATSGMSPKGCLQPEKPTYLKSRQV